MVKEGGSLGVDAWYGIIEHEFCIPSSLGGATCGWTSAGWQKQNGVLWITAMLGETKLKAGWGHVLGGLFAVWRQT